MKLLLDEQISDKVAQRLRGRGHDVVAVAAEQALRGLSDPDVFEVAQTLGRAVVTYNRDDFEAILRVFIEVDRDHRGLIIVHPTRFPGRDFGRLADALSALVAKGDLGRSFVVWLREPGD